MTFPAMLLSSSGGGSCWAFNNVAVYLIRLYIYISDHINSFSLCPIFLYVVISNLFFLTEMLYLFNSVTFDYNYI